MHAPMRILCPPATACLLAAPGPTQRSAGCMAAGEGPLRAGEDMSLARILSAASPGPERKRPMRGRTGGLLGLLLLANVGWCGQAPPTRPAFDRASLQADLDVLQQAYHEPALHRPKDGPPRWPAARRRGATIRSVHAAAPAPADPSRGAIAVAAGPARTCRHSPPVVAGCRDDAAATGSGGAPAHGGRSAAAG